MGASQEAARLITTWLWSAELLHGAQDALEFDSVIIGMTDISRRSKFQSYPFTAAILCAIERSKNHARGLRNAEL